MKISWMAWARVVRLAAMVLAVTGFHASAQSGCLSGNLFMPFNVNGTVKLCPTADSRVPELQKQLDQMQKTLNGNQALLRELTHTARSVNALGGDVDSNRQVELLRSFSRELQGLMQGGQGKTLQIAQLADRLDGLQDSIMQSKEDQKTAQQTTAALQGRLGDAIAALDLTGAQQQLESIQAKLDKIGDDTQQIRRTIEEQAAREKVAAELERKKVEEQDQDPNMYARAQIFALRFGQINNLRLMISFSSRPPLYPPFIDSSLSISFRKGAAAWRIDGVDKVVNPQGEQWALNLTPDDLGDRATVCFAARDKPSGRLKAWTQHYTITSANSLSTVVTFIPNGDAATRLTDGEPCDGVTEVRNTRTQEQAFSAMMRPQPTNVAPAAESFARISAEGFRQSQTNGGQWQIKVKTQPLKATFYDVHVEANLVDEAGRLTPVQLSNRELFSNIESRSGWVSRVPAKAVVCLTARNPALDRSYRLTQWFSIETSRVYGRQGGPDDTATFVPAKPPDLTEASNVACR